MNHDISIFLTFQPILYLPFFILLDDSRGWSKGCRGVGLVRGGGGGGNEGGIEGVHKPLRRGMS